MRSRILEEKGGADISLTLLILSGSPNLKKRVTLAKLLENTCFTI